MAKVGADGVPAQDVVGEVAAARDGQADLATRLSVDFAAQVSYVLGFGGSPSGGNQFFRAWSNAANGADGASSTPRTRNPAPRTGRITKFAFSTTSSDLTTRWEVHVNQVAVATIVPTLTIAETVSINVSVSEGDSVEVKFTTGTAPGQGIYNLYIED